MLLAPALLVVALVVPATPDDPEVPNWCPTRSELNTAGGDHGAWVHVFPDACYYVVAADGEPFDPVDFRPADTSRQLSVTPAKGTWEETVTRLDDGLDRVEVIDDDLVISYPGPVRAKQTLCAAHTPERTLRYSGEPDACLELLGLHSALATE